jgi:hypothetical protein
MSGVIGLHFTLLPASLSARLLPPMLAVADGIIAGGVSVAVEGRALDERSQEQFRDAVRELRELLLSHQSR